jgi:arylsulfatase A-like enzyme
MADLSRRTFLSMAAAATLARTARAESKLNFIIILIDDMGWTDLTSFGSKFYQTPNVDRLVSQGMKFTNAYAACPVCSPSRAAIMTGKYPARLHLTDWIPGRKQWPTAKVIVPEFEQQLTLPEVTIAEALAPEGYTSAAIGKWHLGGKPYYPERQGFAVNIGGTEKGSPPSYFPPYNIPGLEPRFPNDYLTDNLSSRAEQFIESNKDRPFFLYLAHFAVHLPLGSKPEVTAKYKARVSPDNPQHHPVYAGMVEGADDSVGRIMKKLDDLNLTRNTVVIFLSDNGGLRYEGKQTEPITSNAPLRAGKGHLYEGGVRIPMIVRWPGKVKPGSVCDVPVVGADLYPTIVAAAGAQKHSGKPIDGMDIAPLLAGGSGLKRDALYWHYPHYSNQGGVPGGAIRRGDFKLIEFYEDGRAELYNLKEDVGEKHNLAAKYPDKVKEMRRALAEWRRSVNAVMTKPNPKYDAATADQGLTGTEPYDP